MHVAMIMNLVRGLGRGSHIAGESVNNQRIERLWRDVHKDVTECMYKEFYSMNDEGLLDMDNDLHKCALQFVYLPVINERLTAFQNAWNQHKIRTERNRTPEQIWIEGILGCQENITAVADVIATDASLRERLQARLAELGVELEEDEAIPALSGGPTTRIHLSEELVVQLREQIASIENNRDKFTKCIELFENYNFDG